MEPSSAALELKTAIDTEDYERAKDMLLRDRSLHDAPLGYGGAGVLTWVAECRVPRAAPSPERLAFAEWLMANGSDVHQDGDAPLGRAALDGARLPMTAVLVAHGANVNASWRGWFPILFSPCESIDPPMIRWLLDHGADPDCRGLTADGTTALDYLLGTYVRDPERLRESIDILRAAGGTTRFAMPGVLEVVQGRTADLTALLDADERLIHVRLPGLTVGATAERMLTLQGSTLLHVAAEFGQLDVARLLIDRGADVDAAAEFTGTTDHASCGQTPIFHAVTQPGDAGLAMVELLLARGAGLAVRARLPGHCESPGEVVDGTALTYAERFAVPDGPVLRLLRAHGSSSP